MFIVPMSNIQPITSIDKSSAGMGVSKPENGFSGFFQDALQNAREARSVADQDAIKLSLGQTDNLAQVMINSAKASTATSLVVDVAARAVSSYKEIMQMQI